MLFRFRFEQLGGHTHVRLFAGKSETSMDKCGDLVFRNEEWEEFVQIVKRSGVQILPEERL